MILLLQVFLGQMVVMAIIVFVLKKILDGKLIDGAIRHLECWPMESKGQVPNQLIIVTHKPLAEKFRQRIVTAATKHLAASIVPDFRLDPAIMGGMVLWIGETQMDHSLKDRLRQAFPILRL